MWIPFAAPTQASLKSRLRQLYRSHAYMYPTLYLWQQGISVRLRNATGKFGEDDFRAIARMPLSASSLFVDIGANRGQSINALRTIFPGCRIVAFEPNPIPYRQAAAALGRGSGSEIHNIAIGHENGTLSLRTPSCRGVIFDQNASVEGLDLDDLAKFLREIGYTFVRPSNIEFIANTIEVRPLDDFGLKPDFIKIDVEGHEEAVLAGARKTITANLPIMMIEGGERPAVAKKLEDIGYTRFVFDGDNLIRSDEKISSNSFFLHERHLPGLKPH
jgi:FkbM family methyltransferase